MRLTGTSIFDTLHHLDKIKGKSLNKLAYKSYK